VDGRNPVLIDGKYPIFVSGFNHPFGSGFSIDFLTEGRPTSKATGETIVSPAK
jgi:hypothetical protein